MLDLPLIDGSGELVGYVSTSNVASALSAIPEGGSLLTVPPPSVASWWSVTEVAWVAKPEPPSSQHVWDPVGKQWIDPYTHEQRRQIAMDDLRQKRDQELARSDLVALRSLEALLPPAVRAWRKALRDLPETVSDPLAPIELPPEPAGY